MSYADKFRRFNRHEMDAQVAEYRLRHEGIKTALLIYLVAIGRVYG